MTSIRQLFVQKFETRDVDDELDGGDCVSGVGTVWLMSQDCVTDIVDTEAGADTVRVEIDMSCDRVIVARTVEAGKFMVENCVNTTVDPGSCVAIVVVAGGNVMVDRTVLGGSCVVIIEVIPGSGNVVVTVRFD